MEGGKIDKDRILKIPYINRKLAKPIMLNGSNL